MNNTVKYVIEHILANIPRPILQEAFLPKEVRVPNTIDFYINDKILEGRVLNSCNLFGGKKKRILLGPKNLEQVTVPETYSSLSSTTIGIYRVPAVDREHREISHVIELLYPYSSSGFSNINYPSQMAGGRTVGDMAKDVLGSHTDENTFVPPTPLLLSGDMIKLEPPQLAHIDWMAVVLLKYDKDFTNMNQSGIKALANLSLCATKAYIYNELILRIDSAFLAGGQELTTFKEIVQKYEDENEKFDDYLLAVRGAMSADPELISEMLRFLF